MCSREFAEKARNTDRLNYRILGQLEKPALIFLHGFMGSHKDWLTIAEPLSSRFCCVLVDLPGHGNSPPPAPESQNPFRNFSAQLAALADHLKKPRFGLIGYSMGGRLALATAGFQSHRIAFFVAESAHPGPATTEERLQRQEWENRVVADLRSQPFETFLRRWFDLPIFHSLRSRPELVEALIATRLSHSPRNLIQAFQAFALSRQPNLTEVLKSVNVPGLLISGEEDPKYCLLYREFVKSVPTAEQAVIHGAGHHVHLEAPEAFLRALRPFLDSVLRSA